MYALPYIAEMRLLHIGFMPMLHFSLKQFAI
jgi:four helix bundle protein